MLLTKCENPSELIPFLKLDYANNLYFFTYLSKFIGNSDIQFLIAKPGHEIKLALLLTPIHCCISSFNTEFIHAIADQLPPINSFHIVGRSDFVEHLLKINIEPERNKHIYSLCELIKTTVLNEIITESQKASESNLKELIEFYNSNDMLFGAEFRLPAILSWGTAYFIKRDGKIVSCALTTTETNDAAMIGAVYTTPQFRNHGYAKDCISNLIRQVTLHHKQIYLFYDPSDSSLSQLYYSLGFRKTNTWILATRNSLI